MHVDDVSGHERVPRGFPSLGYVHRALQVLVPAIKSGAVPAPSAVPWTGHTNYAPSNAVISVQRLARRILDVYGLEHTTVLATFEPGLEVAGRVELGARNQREIFVELKPSLRGHKKDISATLGHECAHIFLRRHGLELPDRWANEILTDTTAALYGFGALMADTYRVSSTRQATATGTMVTWHEQSMGYLTPDELGYVLTRTGFADVDRYLESSAARDALECGRARALRELAAPPFAHAGLWARVVYGARRLGAQLVMGGPGAPDDDRPYALHDGRITFRCPVCCKLLRLPVGRRLTAACPTCKHSVRCVT